MVAKQVLKHIFAITALVLAFSVSGCVGQICESLHFSMEMGAAAFSITFTSLIATFYKLYQLVVY